MRYRRADVVDRAVALLAEVGLPDLTMRRLGAELGVQASAIYHHFASKQELLGAVADEILARGEGPPPADDADWSGQVAARCRRLRAAVLAYPDGADVVASMFAFGLGGRAPYDDLSRVLTAAGLPADAAGTAARTLLHYVYGHAFDEQAHAQAARLGAIPEQPRADDFDDGLALLLDGIAVRLGVQVRG